MITLTKHLSAFPQVEIQKQCLFCVLSNKDMLNDHKNSPGSQTELGNLIYVPLRNGPTVWEIGYPDRTAFGYYVPDVNPMYVNKLFLNSQEK